jgi:hypothetical protein
MRVLQTHDFSRRDAETQRGLPREAHSHYPPRNLRTLREPILFHAEAAECTEFFEFAATPQISPLCVSASLRETSKAPGGAGAAQ